MDSETTDFNTKVLTAHMLIGRGKPAGKELFGSGIEVYAKIAKPCVGGRREHGGGGRRVLRWWFPEAVTGDQRVVVSGAQVFNACESC